MARCLIALGGNIGVSAAVFDAALSRLERPGVTVTAVSSSFRTQPVGESAGEEFLNAAATLECRLEPRDLLMALHEVEHAFGRARTVHWGPRTLDLDLCLFGLEVMDDRQLVVPHPAMWYRRFVLDPAMEVAAEFIHPVLGQSIRDLHLETRVRPLRIVLRRGETCSPLIRWPDLPATLQTAEDAAENAMEWVLPHEISGDLRPVFAEVIVEGVAVEPGLCTQPRNALSRTITIHAETQQSALEQIRCLRAAILG